LGKEKGKRKKRVKREIYFKKKGKSNYKKRERERGRLGKKKEPSVWF